MTALTTADLTTATAEGQGTFDVLMRSVKQHLDEEFRKGAIKGPEYSEVYLGSLNLAMQTGLSFLLQRQKTGLEVDLLTKQLALADIGLQKATIELAMLTASQPKIAAEIAQIQAQTALLGSQKAMADKQVSIADQELLIKQKQVDISAAELSIAEAKLANIPKEGQQLDAQTQLIGQQKTNLISENLGIIAKTALTDQQKLNAITEETVLVAQECKLRAEFDLTQASTTKVGSEVLLLDQKTATEKAQILSVGVDDNSVVGRQKAL